MGGVDTLEVCALLALESGGSATGSECFRVFQLLTLLLDTCECGLAVTDLTGIVGVSTVVAFVLLDHKSNTLLGGG